MPADDPHQLIQAALQAYEGPLVRYAGRLVGDLERGRDVVQDVFLTLCRQDIGALQGRLKQWLYTVCRHRCIDQLRKEGRTMPTDGHILDESLSGDQTGVDDALQARDRDEVLQAQLDRLPPRDQEVLRLKFQDNLSYQAIAEITGLSVSHVGVILHKTLARLRQALRGQEGSLI